MTIHATQLLLLIFGLSGFAALGARAGQTANQAQRDANDPEDFIEAPSEIFRLIPASATPQSSHHNDPRTEPLLLIPAAQPSAPVEANADGPPVWRESDWTYAVSAFSIVVVGLLSFKTRLRLDHSHPLKSKKVADENSQESLKNKQLNDEFLANISHEISNPMNGIIGLIESLKPEGLNPDTGRKVAMLGHCAAHLSGLLEDILDFSSIQSGAIPIEAEPFTLRELINSVAALTAAESERRGIPIEIAVPQNEWRTLIGDSRRIRQILTNYINNALKFSTGGKVSVSIQQGKSTLGSVEIIFTVSDEGPGIAPEEQAKLFTRFERGPQPQRRQIPGTGLGLALCKTLAEKMGGQVWMNSTVGQGAHFHFSAHFSTLDQDGEGAPFPCRSDDPPTMKALVVDDMEYNRLSLSSQLETFNISAYTAADHCAAITLAHRHNFDLIFLDYYLPELDGPAIAHAIRALPNRSARAKIISTTAAISPTKRAVYGAAGVDTFLCKPITIERLRHALNNLPPDRSENIVNSPPKPIDPLARLRMIASNKLVPLADEIALYFSEFEEELNQFNRALQLEDPGRASYFAHMLYGRCSFIAERGLEQALRQIESFAINGRWDLARRNSDQVLGQLDELRVRLGLKIQVSQSE